MKKLVYILSYIGVAIEFIRIFILNLIDYSMATFTATEDKLIFFTEFLLVNLIIIILIIMLKKLDFNKTKSCIVLFFSGIIAFISIEYLFYIFHKKATLESFFNPVFMEVHLLNFSPILLVALSGILFLLIRIVKRVS